MKFRVSVIINLVLVLCVSYLLFDKFGLLSKVFKQNPVIPVTVTLTPTPKYTPKNLTSEEVTQIDELLKQARNRGSGLNNTLLKEQDYLHVLEIDPYDLDALDELFTIYSFASENDNSYLPKLIDIGTKEVISDPESPSSYGNLGYAYYLNKDYKKALPEFEKAISLYSARLESSSTQKSKVLNDLTKSSLAFELTELGNVYRALNQNDKARQYYDQALEIKPDYIPAKTEKLKL